MSHFMQLINKRSAPLALLDMTALVHQGFTGEHNGKYAPAPD